MSKKKYWVISVITILILVTAGISWRLMAGSNNARQNQKLAASSTPYSSQSLTVSDNTNSVSLTNPTPSPPNSNGLSLMPNTASNDISLNGGSNNNRSSAEAMLDPATFSQYDKYKDAKTSLFADLRVGYGAELTANKKAAVYYKGWLTGGELFDMSRADEKGTLQPFVFTLGTQQVIAGWDQALAGMKVGGVRFVIVPPAVGYGAQGQGNIPGNSVLIFQVQLLAIE
jgi:FKBP-type peptidyl-prolyl cis-trans isomerase FkpA